MPKIDDIWRDMYLLPPFSPDMFHNGWKLSNPDDSINTFIQFLENQ